MLGILSVSVVLENDWVEKVSELLVGVEGSGVDTDSRVEILATREDAGLEGNSVRVSLVLILVPDGLGAVLAHQGGSSSWELGALDKVVGGLEVRSALGLFWLWCFSTTTKFLFPSDHSFHTVVHILDKIDFRSSESPLV